jgi:tetratricopeptide (TPR) repeat protein
MCVWLKLKPALALSALERAAVLNPLNSSVWIELAGAAEAHNDFRAAESSLLRAVKLDKTFAPRWLLAEYYSRRHDQAHFWPAVRAALATSYDDVTPLFDLCWELAPEPRVIQDRALPDRPDVWRQYFDFLLSKNRLDAADGPSPTSS